MRDGNDLERGLTMREDFGGREIARHQASHQALMARAQAEVQARYVMAMQRPRNPRLVHQRLVKLCESSEFAREAIYELPRGRQQVRDEDGNIVRDGRGKPLWEDAVIRDLTIRFAEAAAAIHGNLRITSDVTYEDAHRRELSVEVSDLETNASWSRQVTVTKAIERKSAKDREVLGERVNSYNEKIYIVVPTDAELKQLCDVEVSKAARTLILRLLPADTKAECKARCIALIQAGIKQDPEGELKKILAGFARLNIMPDKVEAYLGHPLEVATPAQVASLRSLWVALDDGELTWAQAMAQREESGELRPAEPAEKRDAKRRTDQAPSEAKRAAPAPAAAPKPQPANEPAPAAQGATMNDLWDAIEALGITVDEAREYIREVAQMELEQLGVHVGDAITDLHKRFGKE